MNINIVARITVLLGLFTLPGRAQQPRPESALIAAINNTAVKGFTYTIKPVVSIPHFSKVCTDLAGVLVEGEYEDGRFHAKDRTYEIYRKGRHMAVRTGRGWLPLRQFTSPLRQEVKQVFDPKYGKLWRRGNVTQGKKALRRLIQIDHLIHRSDISRLTNVGSAFSDVGSVGTRRIGGAPADLYEGYLNDMTAFNLLQGPFEELVRRGNLSFQNVSGIARVYLQDGVVRRIHAKASAKYGSYDEEDNVRRRGLCSLEMLVEITKVGETHVELPKEVAQIFDRPND